MILLIVAFAALALIQIPRLVRKKCWRELFFFCLFFVFSFAVSLLQAAEVKLPSPAKGIKAFLDMINFHL